LRAQLEGTKDRLIRISSVRLLSFDTSTTDLHICLSDEGQIAAQCVVKSNPQDRQYAATLLIPTIAELFNKAKWRKSDLQAIVVGVGPGRFTGTRIAVVSGRTMAQALSLPLLGVSILECYAFQKGSSTGVVLASDGKGYYLAAYEAVPLVQVASESKIVGHLGQQLELICVIPPCYTQELEVRKSLAKGGHWLLDSNCMGTFAEGQAIMEAVPNLKNIACVQSELALNRLSLWMARQENSGNNGIGDKTLRTAFPYESVEPLYLRNASITLKKP
jgi:tRNA threonylcarbamoyl adenosine modification protein YeaZ